MTAYGTLTTMASHAAAEYVKGARTAMIELSWRDWETAPGKWDYSKITQAQSDIAAYRNAGAGGMDITLSLGLHYVPLWTTAYVATQQQFFTAKPGGVVTQVDRSTSPTAGTDMVWSAEMRALAERYVRKVAAELGMKTFKAIRITSGGRSELLYPQRTVNSATVYDWWCYGDAPQKGIGIAHGQTICPFPGYVPDGTTNVLSQANQALWLDWYLGSLANAGAWQTRLYDSLGFTGLYQWLMPGSGVRPSVLTALAAAPLPASTLAGCGAAWERIARCIPSRKRSAVYCTSVADGSGSDTPTQTTDASVAVTDSTMNAWGAMRFLARVAKEYGLQIHGENPGFGLGVANSKYQDTTAAGLAALAMGMVTAANADAFYWAHDFRLYDGTLPDTAYLDRVTTAQAGATPGRLAITP